MSAVLDEQTARALLKQGRLFKTKVVRIRAVQLESETKLTDGTSYPAGSYLCDTFGVISIMPKEDFEDGFDTARAVKPKKSNQPVKNKE